MKFWLNLGELRWSKVRKSTENTRKTVVIFCFSSANYSSPNSCNPRLIHWVVSSSKLIFKYLWFHQFHQTIREKLNLANDFSQDFTWNSTKTSNISSHPTISHRTKHNTIIFLTLLYYFFVWCAVNWNHN